MTDNPEREILEKEKLQWQWYVDYDTDKEYEKHPQWAVDMRTEESEVEDDDSVYNEKRIKFYDKFDPEHMWIKSSSTVSLMKMR
jgi:hypothetical protein